MGVKFFFSWVRKNFPNSIINSRNKDFKFNVDELLLDLNGIFHQSVNKLYNPQTMVARYKMSKLGDITDKMIFSEICKYIKQIVDIVRPKKKIVLCVDGVAPLSKQQQQRQRRFKSGKEVSKFDRNCITPGTKFMVDLNSYLDSFINGMVDRYWRDIEVIYSSHLVPGEGEAKIFQYIRNSNQEINREINRKTLPVSPSIPITNDVSSIKPLPTRYCVYSPDADVIMLSMAAKDLLTTKIDIDIIREDTFYDGLYTKIDTSLLASQIEEYIGIPGSIRDFVFMCFLVGNDFLPNIPFIDILSDGIDTMLEIYTSIYSTYGGLLHRETIDCKGTHLYLSRNQEEMKETDTGNPSCNGRDTFSARNQEEMKEDGTGKQRKNPSSKGRDMCLTLNQEEMKEIDTENSRNNPSCKGRDMCLSRNQDNSINLKAFKVFCQGLAKYEKDLMYVKSQTVYKYPDPFLEASTVKVILNDNQSTTGQTLTSIDIDLYKNLYYTKKLQGSLTQISHDYIEGMQWVINYYLHGITSWDWRYKYHYAPFMSDIVKYIDSYQQVTYPPSFPSSPFLQLISVLPPSSARLIPYPLNTLLIGKSPLHEYYPEEFVIDNDGKKFEWEGISILPILDMNKVRDVYNETLKNVRSDELKYNISTSSYRYKYDSKYAHILYGNVYKVKKEKYTI